MQRHLQVEAEDQTPAEECEGCIDWNEAHYWVRGEKHTAIRQFGGGK